MKIWDLEVKETRHYSGGTGEGFYSFKYSIKINNEKTRRGFYESSWSNQTKNQFLKALNGGYLMELVLEDAI